MSKKPVTTTTHDLTPLITELRGLIHSAREYQFYLPSKELLRQKLQNWKGRRA
jgi:hypothetical protein